MTSEQFDKASAQECNDGPEQTSVTTEQVARNESDLARCEKEIALAENWPDDGTPMWFRLIWWADWQLQRLYLLETSSLPPAPLVGQALPPPAILK